MHGLRSVTLRLPARRDTLVISMRGKRSGVFRGPSSPGADSGVATGKAAKECQQQCQSECEIRALFEHGLASRGPRVPRFPGIGDSFFSTPPFLKARPSA